MRIPSVAPARASSTKRRQRAESPSGESFLPLTLREAVADPAINSSAPAVPADPRLRAILDEIELRARVEIAKYDHGA